MWPRRPSARRWPRRVLITVNIVVAFALVTAAGAYGYVNWRLGQIHREHLPSLSPNDKPAGSPSAGIPSGNAAPFTLLLVGSDSRAALKGGNNSQFGGTTGANGVTGQRSDTIILLRVVPATRQLMILSIPRDLWVDIPGNGYNRINAAFNSGADLLIRTIETDLHIPVNHYAEVNFDTFRDISNAVGGVKFYFPTPAKDAYSNLDIKAPGCYSLKGNEALAFVRSRHYQYYENGSWHYEASSDLARIRRQQAFIKKMIKKAESKYTNLAALNGVIGGVTKNLTVDSGFSTSLMLDMARDFHGIDVSKIKTLTLPNYPFTTSGGAEVLGLQQPEASRTIADFETFGAPKPKSKAKPKANGSTTAPATTRLTAPPVTVAPSSVSIEVANGSGVSGQAGLMVRFLAGLGYQAGLGSSSGYGHATTVVEYAPDSLAAAEQVAAAIPGGATLVESSALTPTAYNLEVITGASYTAGAPTGIISSSSSSSPTTSTTIPGTNSSVYTLPGASGPPPASC